MIFLLGWACSQKPTPEWSSEVVLSAHRARLDRDGDGRVSAEEYERTLWNGPPFGSVDVDHNNDLSISELESLTKTQSPGRFDGSSSENSVKEAEAGVVMPTEAQRNLSEMLVWMVETLVAAGQPVPTEAEVQAAIQTGDWNAPPSKKILQTIRPGWEKAGLQWPSGLP